MLFSERKRERETAEREAAGENLWEDDFSETAHVRLIAIAEAFNNRVRQHNGANLAEQVATRLRARIGLVVDHRIGALASEDPYVTLDWLGAAHEVLDHPELTNAARTFATLVNDVLRQERIAYKFVDGSIVEFASDELNIEVVEPAVRLLVGRKFDAAHGAYMNALKEITNGEPGDAITDAGTALQETLQALGCEGNALGPLLKDAKKLGLLGSHDQTLIDGIAKFVDWASADRSTTGDAHKHSQAAVADAWLMVHIVGALIVRLADGTPRGSTT